MAAQKVVCMLSVSVLQEHRGFNASLKLANDEATLVLQDH